MFFDRQRKRETKRDVDDYDKVLLCATMHFVRMLSIDFRFQHFDSVAVAFVCYYYYYDILFSFCCVVRFCDESADSHRAQECVK